MNDSWKYIASATDNEPLINRAYAAWFRSATKGGYVADTPANDSHLCELDGKQYVVLHNIRGVLAVYRVRNNNMLKRLTRWAAELTKEFSS